MIEPSALRPHYSRFLGEGEGGRVLLTGHSHQAWPDCGRDGLLEAFDDAARLVDEKWTAAMAKADLLRDNIATRIGAEPDEIALAQNTHELVSRFLSGLELGQRPHLVTTGGEFHSLYRQLTRLGEAGISVTWVDPQPLDTLAERLVAALRPETAALLVSSVLFESSSIVPELGRATRTARARGVEVLVDAYHAFGALPVDVESYGPGVFLTAGGYKYAQWGEGCAFLRVPRSSELRPIYTGWFSDFSGLDAPRGAKLGYGARPCDRFGGATYEPASHYRAARVIEFFASVGIDDPSVRELSLVQTQRLIDGLTSAGFELVTPREPGSRGAFVTVRHAEARGLCAALRQEGVYTDARGTALRFGPAIYTTDDEIDRGVAAAAGLLGG